jgi:hypothetical protein
MRRRMGLAGIGPVVGLLMVILLAACGQSGATPAVTATPPGARLGIPGTPNLATPVTPVGTFTQTTIPASPTRAPGSATPTEEK